MWLEFWHAWFNTKNTEDVLNYCTSIEKSDTKSRFILYDIGCAYFNLGKFDKSVNMFWKVELLSAEWGGDWKYRDYYTWYANACHNAGMFNKEAKVLEAGLKLFPDNDKLIFDKARLAILGKKTEEANELIARYKLLSKQNGQSESDIQKMVDLLFQQAKSIDAQK
jgi:tetratricopeptide (TPR) repeat protein